MGVCHQNRSVILQLIDYHKAFDRLRLRSRDFGNIACVQSPSGVAYAICFAIIQLPAMIPMGTVIAVTLLIGAVTLPFVHRLPRAGVIGLGLLLEAAGIWNTFWYGLQHFFEFWGQMALWSGLVMFTAGALCLRLHKDGFPEKMAKAKPLLSALMGAFGVYYGWTIYNL